MPFSELVAFVGENTLRGVALVFGLLWGSFLNVVIYRVPRGMSVVRPPSHCPACGEPVRAFQNVPVLAYLVLRGRAACCGAPMTPRYLLVELIGGLLSLAVFEMLVLPLAPTETVLHAAAVYVACFTLALGLVAGAFIDLEHMILPDSITLGGAVLGVFTASFRSMSFTDALIGAVVGFLVVWLPFDVLYRRIRGQTGMAMGDAKLLMLAGAWFGWSGALIVLGAGAVQGTIVALGFKIFGKEIEEPEEVRKEREAILAQLEALPEDEQEARLKELEDDPIFEQLGEGFGQSRIAFGPFLSLAIIEYLFFGDGAVKLVLV